MVSIGLVVECSEKHNDVKLNFMRRSPKDFLVWPRLQDVCWVSYEHILHIVETPSVKGRSARDYTLLDEDLKNCKEQLKLFQECQKITADI